MCTARLTAVILENGVVRTLDPSLPTARALAIAGAHIAGGVGVHESALASPETVDLGGRCVLPAFTDSHVHFPTWSLNQLQVQLDGCASLGETLSILNLPMGHPASAVLAELGGSATVRQHEMLNRL